MSKAEFEASKMLFKTGALQEALPIANKMIESIPSGSSVAGILLAVEVVKNALYENYPQFKKYREGIESIAEKAAKEGRE